MKTKITSEELKSKIMDIFSEEIHTSIGYVGPDMPAAEIEGRDSFEAQLAKLLNEYDIIKQCDGLPENWAVQNDGSKLFKNTVIKYLNDKYNPMMFWEGSDKKFFYGVNNSLAYDYDNGTFASETLPKNTIILTIKEFIEATK